MADDLMQYETYRGLAKGLSNPMSHRQQREWLHRSKDWPDLGGENNYKARKIVGAGGHGICGLWEYTGDSPDKPKHLVVKQVGTKDEGLRVESKLMRDIMRAGGSDHIVKLYKSAYSEGGSGTSKARDPWPFTSGGKYRKKYQVSRLFMEYCENGNLASEIAEVVRNGYDLPEEYIWRAFECLASALVFLDHGNEETDDDAETWDSPISHFDIKPGNILIGTHDENHPRLPVLKLSDFGLGLPVPSQVRNAEKWQTWNRKRKRIWMEDAQWRATPGYIPPEQLYHDYKKRIIGLSNNIWSAGVIIYELMTRTNFQRCTVIREEKGREIEVRQRFFKKETNTAWGPRKFYTFGRRLLKSPYSKRLVDLVHQCLALDPRKRPPTRYVLRTVRETLSTIEQASTSYSNEDEQVMLGEYEPDPDDTTGSRYTAVGIDEMPTERERFAIMREPTADLRDWGVEDEVDSPALLFDDGPYLDRNNWPWPSALDSSPSESPRDSPRHEEQKPEPSGSRRAGPQRAESQRTASQHQVSQKAKSQPTASQPAASQPVASQPAAPQPVASQPAASQPAASQPAASQPAASQPAASQPAASQPAALQLAVPQPAAPQPVASQPAASQPVAPQQAIPAPPQPTQGPPQGVAQNQPNPRVLRRSTRSTAGKPPDRYQ